MEKCTEKRDFWLKQDCHNIRAGSSIRYFYLKRGYLLATTAKGNVRAEQLVSVSFAKVEKNAKTFRPRKNENELKNPKLRSLIPNEHN